MLRRNLFWTSWERVTWILVTKWEVGLMHLGVEKVGDPWGKKIEYGLSSPFGAQFHL